MGAFSFDDGMLRGALMNGIPPVESSAASITAFRQLSVLIAEA